LIPAKYPEDLISLASGYFFGYLRLVLDMTHGSGVWRITVFRPLFLFTHVSLVLLGLEFTIVCPALA
jgi:hypothetical protein